MAERTRFGRSLATLACAILTAATATAAEPADATMKVVDRKGYDAAIAEHRGKVVVVDFWALWCTSCLREFSHTVDWHEEYDDLQVVSMSFDDDAQAEAAVAFLKKKEAKFPHLRSKWGSAEESFEAWNIPSGTLPHFKIYGRDGKLVKAFDAGDDPDGPSFTHEDVEAAIKQALATKPR